MSKYYDGLMKVLGYLENHPEKISVEDEKALEKLYAKMCKVMGVSESAKWVVDVTVQKFADAAAHIANMPFETRKVKQNIVVDGGATAMLNLICGISGTQAFNSTNAHIGVGTSTTAENASQTGLLAGSSNQAFKGMDSGYPQVSGRTMTFKSTFDESEANFAWQEVGVFNGGSGSTMLNRRVTSLGTKVTGIWTVQVQISVTSNT